MKTRVLRIVRGTTVDGPGFRTSIYFSGCRHECPGCHNPQSWDFSSGDEMDINEILEIVKEEDFNVTFTGGDPLYQPDFMARLAKEITALGYKIWLYTGFTWEEILENATLRDSIGDIEVIVEGRYINALRNTDLKFKGSENQRIIRVNNTNLPLSIIEF